MGIFTYIKGIYKLQIKTVKGNQIKSKNNKCYYFVIKYIFSILCKIKIKSKNKSYENFSLPCKRIRVAEVWV